MRISRRGILAAFAASLAVSLACGDATGPDTVPAEIVLIPTAASLPAGGTLQLSSLVLTASGRVLTDKQPAYSSNNPDVATVTANGLVTAVGPVGSANITARVGAVMSLPTTIAVTAATARSIVRETDLPPSPVVGTTHGVVAKVTDAFGNGIPGISVTFAVVAGGGSVAPTTAFTDASGVARTSFTIGTRVDANIASASAAGLVGSPLTFSANSVAGPAHSIVKVGHDPVSVSAGAAFGDSIRVQVADNYGNPKPGASVAFALIAGGGTVSPTPVLTDASGMAAAKFITGPAIGWNSATATLSGQEPVWFAIATTLPWLKVETGTTQSLGAVWGTSASDVWAVGASGTILHYNGTSWSSVPSGTTRHLGAVWGTSPSDVWAAGTGGIILHYDGTSWSSVPSGTTESLADVWGSSSTNVWAVGSEVTIRHYDGTRWSGTSCGGGYCGYFRDIWGSSASAIWGVGGWFGSGAIWYYDGTEWERFAQNPANAPLSSVWGSSPYDVWAVGVSHILHYNGATWSLVPSGHTGLQGVWGSSPSDVWAVGLSGLIAYWDGSPWRRVLSGTTEHLFDIWGSSATNVWAVGAGGTILHGSLPQ